MFNRNVSRVGFISGLCGVLAILAIIGVRSARSAPGGKAVGVMDTWCQYSYRSDSYGRGIQAGIKNQNLRPKYLDEMCYELGQRYARQLVSQEGATDCDTQFDEGLKEGEQVGNSNAGTSCFMAGYQAGVAKINVGARENKPQLSSYDCISTYQRGRTEGANQLAENPPADQPSRNCYIVGHFDGVYFGAER